MAIALVLVAATGLALGGLGGVAPVSTSGSEEPVGEAAASAPQEPLRVHIFEGTIETSAVPEEPAPTQVILGPTSKNDAKFEVGAEAGYVVLEVAWESDEIREIGAVLYHRKLDLGPAGEETLFGWDHLTWYSGASPLYLAVPIDSEGRYSWTVYPLPGQVILHLDFKSAISVFLDVPPADYRVFPPQG